MNTTLPTTPVPGMGLTFSVGSDRYAGTVTRVSPSGKRFWFTEDRETLRSGGPFTEEQVYLYQPNPDGRQQAAYRDQKGSWRVMGRRYPLYLGRRAAKRDPSF